jgi:hypothetical protein
MAASGSSTSNQTIRICAVQASDHEADDVLASSAALAGRGGWRTVLVTSDRDAVALLDCSTSVLRVRNGGLDRAVLVTADSLPEVCGVQPWQQLGRPAARELVNRNRRLIRMTHRPSGAAPGLHPDTARLPLDLLAMRQALTGGTLSRP